MLARTTCSLSKCVSKMSSKPNLRCIHPQIQLRNSSSHKQYSDVFPDQHRTGITALLWKQQKLESEKLNKATNVSHTVPHNLVTKTPRDSHVEVEMPFSTNIHLRDQYLSPFGHLRMGRILEDLDAMAGNIAFRHADDGNPESKPLTIVTASVDSIKLHHQLDPTKDMRMSGCVTWVGRSSMEIEITVASKDSQVPSIVAYVTMVATDTATGKSTEVNPLEPQTPAEKEKFARGERNKQLRLERRNTSLSKQPPTADERFVIHDIFMESQKQINNVNHIAMSTTKNNTIVLCQPSERNIHNKIFGGYLMRKGFELAFSTSFLFSRTQPFFVGMDDVAFLKPVEIGSILSLKAQVIFTEEKFVQVEVIAHVIDPEVGKEQLTNVFNFTFECKNYQPENIKKVIPQTYAEAMKYLEGRRRHNSQQKHISQ